MDVVTGPLVAATAGAGRTRDLAGALAGLCVPGDVVLLAGDLGAGKTTFAQGFGRALGIVEAVTSPTFTLVRQYPVDPGPNRGLQWLIHADVYRLDHLREITDLGIGELVEDGGVALVEWGDAAAPVLGGDALTVRLDAVVADAGDDAVDADGPAPGPDERRTLTVSAEGDRWADRWAALAAALSPWTAP